MYLVDTNVLILAIKSQDPDKSFLKRAILQKKLYLSVISISEFYSQAAKEAETRLEELIIQSPVLSVNLETARIAASYRKKSLKHKRIHMLDCFLAAQAKLHNLILVTNNRSDFPIRDIKVIAPYIP